MLTGTSPRSKAVRNSEFAGLCLARKGRAEAGPAPQTPNFDGGRIATSRGSAARVASCVTVAPRKPPPRVAGRVSSAAKETAAANAPRGPSEPPSPDRERRKESRGATAGGGDRFSSSVACQRGSFVVARRNAGTTERIGLEGTSMSGDFDFVLSNGEPVALFFVDTRDIGNGFGPRRLRWKGSVTGVAGGGGGGGGGGGRRRDGPGCDWRFDVRRWRRATSTRDRAVAGRTAVSQEGEGRSW